MKESTAISNVVIRRLSRYRSTLKCLLEKGVHVISSTDLGDLVSLTASQIRQDLHNFGSFGVYGHGYNIKRLHHQINMILGLNSRYKIIIIGTENLGPALANYIHFKPGFDTVAFFDFDPNYQKKKISNIKVLNFNKIDKFLNNNEIDIGIITTSMEKAQIIADRLVKGGVRGIWNFTATDLLSPDGVAIENVNLSDSLHCLIYQIYQENLMKQ